MAARFADHPLRGTLNHEIHARPHVRLDGPTRGFHLAIMAVEQTIADERARLNELCRLLNIDAPALPADAKHMIINLAAADDPSGRVRLAWEGHTEFCTYTFFHEAPFDAPFDNNLIDRLPGPWRDGLNGLILDAVHFALSEKSATQGPRSYAEVAQLFDGHSIVGSNVAGQNARIYMDMQVGTDGFSRLLIDNRNLTSGQAGRLIQRLLEISSYRMTALLGLPAAHQTGPHLRRIDQDLVAVADSLAPEGTEVTDAQLHAQLSTINSEIERFRAQNSYRFDASQAYHQLIGRLLTSLREDRIEGLQALSEFLDRRLGPAMRTCQSIAARQEALSRRANRMASLLRARIDVTVEQQNQDLLASMDRRARTQLHLQETVEGLSVVAISYYLIGLVSYALKALKSGGVNVDADIGTGIALPIVAVLVWAGVRRIRRALVGKRTD